jgi:hypothetical protein
MFFLCRRPRSFWIAALVLILSGGLLGGCASSNVPAPAPAVDEAQDTTWAVVPILPPAGQAEEVSWNRHRKMVDETAKMLSAYEQTFSVYGQSENKTGIPPDTLYESAGTDGKAPSFDDTVLSRIREKTGAKHLLLTRADQWYEADGDDLRFFVGISSDGIGGGIQIPIGNVGDGRDSRLVTSAMLVNASTEEVLWEGARFTGASSANSDLGRAAALGSRSLVVEMMTGRALPYSNFLFEKSSGDLLVYRYNKGSVIAESVRMARTEMIVEKKEGPTVRYPIHTVSTVKNTIQREVVFPSYKNPNFIRPGAQN